jgi:hypothetical protein
MVITPCTTDDLELLADAKRDFERDYKEVASLRFETLAIAKECISYWENSLKFSAQPVKFWGSEVSTELVAVQLSNGSAALRLKKYMERNSDIG